MSLRFCLSFESLRQLRMKRNSAQTLTNSAGLPLSRSQSDSARTSPIGDPTEDKVIVSELRNASNRRSNGTPIDQEMSKEVESKHNPPSVVAKLMGLDTLPRQQSDSAAQRSYSRDYARSHSAFAFIRASVDHSLTTLTVVHSGCDITLAARLFTSAT